MKTLILLLVSVTALAQTPRAPTPGSMVPGQVSKDFNNQGKTVATPSEVTGSCIIIPGEGNLVTIPCTEIILNLEKPKGGSISTRSDKMGNFEFATEFGEAYHLASGSSHYRVVAPKDLVHSGSRDIKVQLQLNPK